MDDLTQAYAHLEFNSKLASAQAMTWIDKTSLAQAEMVDVQVEKASPNASLQDFISNALAFGMPMEIVQVWLKECDLSQIDNLQEHFSGFMKSYLASRT